MSPLRCLRRLTALLVGSVFVVACAGAAPKSAKPPAEAATGEAEPGPPPDIPPNGPPTALDCGDFTTCAVAADGAMFCWGRDKGGELGDGRASNGSRLKRGLVPGLGTVRTIALGAQFGCALLEGGTVKCWGSGRIANDGKRYSHSKPVDVVGVTEAEELVASGAIACARGPSGVTCWGSDEETIGTPPKTKLKQIATGFTHACGLDAKGAVTCWGQGDWSAGGAWAKPGVTGAVQVVLGDRHGCVVTKSKTVQCWGMNDAGQLGIKPDMKAYRRPVTVPGLKNVARLVSGEASTCALLGDGSVRCWGANGEGELGLGTRSSDERPTRVDALGDVEHLCLATAHGCALTKNGKLLCWGANAFGQLGDGTQERRSEPVPVVW